MQVPVQWGGEKARALLSHFPRLVKKPQEMRLLENY